MNVATEPVQREKVHRYFTRQPKPPTAPGLDYHSIGGPGGFIRYEARRCSETIRVRRNSQEAEFECRWHRLDCCPVWRPRFHLRDGLFIDGISSSYSVVIQRGALDHWTGSGYMATHARIFFLADGTWVLGSQVFKTLLRAVRFYLVNQNQFPVQHY